jgi:hypothetical protein
VNLLWDLRHGHENIDARLNALDVHKLSEGAALNLVGILIKNRFYADHAVDYATQQCLEGFGALDLPQAIAGYKPRPLEGVWATPPFLHNGSVPTLYDLLLPPDQRPQTFYLGSREFDPEKVGYLTAQSADNSFAYRTRDEAGRFIDGNSNAGHDYGNASLSEAERRALVEYMKSL